MFNHLKNEDSPYLLQHANNPIDWYPWGEEALNRAKSENKSIFLSIGYSSSYWCQVMNLESFQDEKIAELLNERFIAIKVDKEERPDIEKYYQKVYKLMNRRDGGSPLSLLLTENLEPYYAAVYIAPTAHREEFGFEELLRSASKKYITEYDTLVEKGKEILVNINPKEKSIEATKLSLDITKTITIHTENLIDKKYGGFGQAPKFPHASTLALLFDTFELTDDETLLNSALLTLDGMAKGGFYDHVDGGFHRYSTDEKWFIPNFEKTTYDNAQLIDNYLRAFQLTGDFYYRNIAFNTIEFMLSKMGTQINNSTLFYSTSDAKSDKIDGKYFTFSYDEVINIFQENSYSLLDITKICTTLNITKDGDFNGENIIRIDNPKDLNLNNYPDIIKLLQEIRKTKTYPFVDKKIITSWNAMMISVLFKAGTIDEKYKNIAIDSLEKLLDTLYINETLYHSLVEGKVPKNKAYLEDYAYLGEALITAYQVTLDESYLNMATNFANTVIEQFYKYGKWNFSNGEFEIEDNIYDSSYPSSISTALSLLMSVSSFVDETYKKFVFNTLELNSYNIMRQPLSSPKLTQVTIRYLKNDIIFKTNLKEQL
jgi:uncharacterized protein YyaL (SSP411 family)